MQFKAEEKGIALKFIQLDKLPKTVTGDPTRLSQILINLLGNAIKFTSRGDVQVIVDTEMIRLEDPAGLKAKCTFTVKDTGIGMTPDQLSKLFKSYSQASSDTARKYGGTGLGLSITKQLVDMQGGTIHASSVPGEGSAFTFSLTYPVSNDPVQELSRTTLSEEIMQDLEGLRILVVDDNEYNRIVARETLEMKIRNVMVDEAFDGETAIRMIHENKYDLVLMDLIMPGIDGLEATRQIRQSTSEQVRRIPILALTASVIKSEINRALDAGMDGFIPKPFKSFELLNAIHHCLKDIKMDYTEVLDMIHGTVSVKNETVDLNHLREFTEGDEARMNRFIELFVSKIPPVLNQLQQDLQSREFDKMRIAAHSIKPQLRSMGIMNGLEIAENIEQLSGSNPDAQKLDALLQELKLIGNSAVKELERVRKV